MHKPTFMDAGLLTSIRGHTAGAAHYVSLNTKQAPVDPCQTAKIAATGSATAVPVLVKVAAPGCCVAVDNASITLPCCSMIYEQPKYVEACKVIPYYSTPAEKSVAGALRC